MVHMIDGLALRRVLGRKTWFPAETFGYGWKIDSVDGTRRVLVTPWTHSDAIDWIHASISRRQPDDMPDYDDLKVLHRAAFGDGYAYQMFVPAASHINITANVLHLWGHADGSPAMPDFGMVMGSI